MLTRCQAESYPLIALQICNNPGQISPRRRAMPNRKKLSALVAVVTGASRGAGRGIACVLGEAGATVYVTGRSTRGSPATDQMPGTIEDTAEEVTRRGGRGIPARCDHTVDEQ